MLFLNIIFLNIFCCLVFLASRAELLGTSSDGEDTRADRLLLCNEFFEVGSSMCDNGEFKESLAFLRAALRLNPIDKNVLLKLGNCEKNAEIYDKSFTRFLKVLIDKPETRDIPEEICSLLPLIDKSILTKKNFKDCMLFQPLSVTPTMEKPFVLRKALMEWNWNLSDFSPENLLIKHKNDLCEVYPQNMLALPTRQYKIKLGNVIEYLRFPDTAYHHIDASEMGLYAQWNMNLNQFEDVKRASYTLESFIGEDSSRRVFGPKCLGKEPALASEFALKLHWLLMTIGEKNSGIFFHEDEMALSSWQAQVLGRKAWILCPPLQKSNEYQGHIYHQVDFHGHCPLCSDIDFDVKKSLKHVESLLPCNVSQIIDDNYSCPSLPSSTTSSTSTSTSTATSSATSTVTNAMTSQDLITCYLDTIEKGDVLYYPRGWWHATYNLDHLSMAISSSIVTRSDLPFFMKDLEKICHNEQQNMRYQFSPELCQFLENQCFPLWDSSSSSNLSLDMEL